MIAVLCPTREEFVSLVKGNPARFGTPINMLSMETPKAVWVGSGRTAVQGRAFSEVIRSGDMLRIPDLSGINSALQGALRSKR